MTYKSRGKGGHHGYQDYYFCANRFAFDYVERIATLERAKESANRRMLEFLSNYDFESYEIINKENEQVNGVFIPYYGFAGSPPYGYAQIKVLAKGKPRRNNFYLRNETLVLFTVADKNQILEIFNPERKEYEQFWDNRFLKIGDRIRTRVGFFDTKNPYHGLIIHACFKNELNRIVLNQEIEFEVQEDFLSIHRGSINRCGRGLQFTETCTWPLKK